MMNDGCSPAPASTRASIEDAVVLPCVPATAIVRRVAAMAASTRARLHTGIPSSAAARKPSLATPFVLRDASGRPLCIGLRASSMCFHEVGDALPRVAATGRGGGGGHAVEAIGLGQQGVDLRHQAGAVELPVRHEDRS